MRRALLAALAALLLFAGPVAAAKPPQATITLLTAGTLHHGDYITFGVTTTSKVRGSVWVRMECTSANGGELIYGAVQVDGTAGPLPLGAGLPAIAPGSSGFSSGDWTSGAGDCSAYVWLWPDWPKPISTAVAFHVEP